MRVTEKEGEKRSSELREKEREGLKRRRASRSERNTVEGKRESETARERDVRVTPAARRVASRRLASPRVTQSSGHGSEEAR